MGIEIENKLCSEKKEKLKVDLKNVVKDNFVLKNYEKIALDEFVMEFMDFENRSYEEKVGFHVSDR